MLRSFCCEHIDVEILADCQVTDNRNAVWTKLVIFLGLLKYLQGFGQLRIITQT